MTVNTHIFFFWPKPDLNIEKPLSDGVTVKPELHAEKSLSEDTKPEIKHEFETDNKHVKK